MSSVTVEGVLREQMEIPPERTSDCAPHTMNSQCMSLALLSSISQTGKPSIKGVE